MLYIYIIATRDIAKTSITLQIKLGKLTSGSNGKNKIQTSNTIIIWFAFILFKFLGLNYVFHVVKLWAVENKNNIVFKYKYELQLY